MHKIHLEFWIKNWAITLSVRFNKFSFIVYSLSVYVDLLSSANETEELRSVTNARRLYSSCIDEANIEREGIDPILFLINTEFGGWPILQGSSWDSSTFNLSNLLLKLRQYNYNIIFRINTDTDEKNSSATNILVS